MSTNIITIPQAVVDFLNANVGSFNTTFLAERKNYPSLEIKDFTDIKVHVLTASKIIEVDTRGSTHTNISVPLLVNKRLNKDKNQTEIDTLIEFVDSISDFLLKKTIPSTKFTCMSSSINALPAMDRLTDENVFTGALTLTYFDGNR